MVVGVPEIKPAFWLTVRVRPGGSAPADTVHEYVPVPPEAVSVVE